jgi:hypothetical protein
MTRHLPALLVLAVGCDGETLPDESFLDRQRILGARITSDGASEALAGALATVEVLAWSPTGDPSVLVALCAPDPEDLDAPCPKASIVESAKDRDFTTSEDQVWARENGLLGVLPDLPVVFPVPDPSRGQGQGGGRSYLPLDLVAWSPGEADERGAVTLVAVDDSVVRNQNPGTPGVELDGVRIERSLTVDGGDVVELAAVAAEAPETFTDPGDGPVDEIYTYRWYSDLGELAPSGLDLPIGTPANEVMEWTLPEGADSGVLYLVVRDGRGGMAWSIVDVTVR